MKNLAIIGGGVQAGYFGEACHRLGYEGHYFSMADGEVDAQKANQLQFVRDLASFCPQDLNLVIVHGQKRLDQDRVA